MSGDIKKDHSTVAYSLSIPMIGYLWTRNSNTRRFKEGRFFFFPVIVLSGFYVERAIIKKVGGASGRV